MLAKKPEDRFESAADVAEILAEFADFSPDWSTATPVTPLTIPLDTTVDVSNLTDIFRTEVEGDALVARFTSAESFQTGSINDTLASLSILIGSAGGSPVVLDFSDIAFLGSPALGMLLSVRKHAESAQIKLRLRGLSSLIREVFEVTRLDRIFSIDDPNDVASS